MTNTINYKNNENKQPYKTIQTYTQCTSSRTTSVITLHCLGARDLV